MKNIYHLHNLLKFHWDQTIEMVVIANNEAEARSIALEAGCADEKIWMDPKKASCTQIGVANEDQEVGPVCVKTIYG